MQFHSQEPEQGTLIGNEAIARYIGINACTVWRWRHEHGLPVATLPGGNVMTTKSLIDEWLLARVTVNDQRVTSDTSCAGQSGDSQTRIGMPD